MNLASALVLAAAAPAAAGDNGIQDFFAGPTGTFMFMGLMLVFAYLLLIRPAQQRQRDHVTMVKAVKRGDTVVMSNGMIGKVVRVEEEEVGVEIAQNVTVKVLKDMLHQVRTRGEPAPANANTSAKAPAKVGAKDAKP
jgi:preprotein translocase subunit YajC